MLICQKYDIITEGWIKLDLKNEKEQYLKDCGIFFSELSSVNIGLKVSQLDNSKNILICETGDPIIDEQYTKLINDIKNKNKISLYSTNLNIPKLSNITALPRGVLSSHKELLSQMEHGAKKTNLVYANFQVRNLPIRQEILNFILNNKFINYDPIFKHTTKLPSIKAATQKFYDKVVTHKFNICPPGWGLDTYRMWESLYLGSIPIVIKSNFTSYFKNLPILEIEDINILTEDFLNKQYKKIMRKKYNLEMLNRNYWINKWYNEVIYNENINNRWFRIYRFILDKISTFRYSYYR